MAAEVAPVIDRLRMAVVGRLSAMTSEVSARFGVAAGALPVLGMLRNTLPDRVAAVDDVLNLFLYLPPDQVRASLDQLVADGALVTAGDGGVALTEAGRAIVLGLFAETQVFLDELWADHDAVLAAVLPLADRACAAATESGGAAVRVVAPPYDPPGASPALRLAERLTPLRFHRFDAHADAWRAEGLTVAEVQVLGAGPVRDRIEQETNRRAAAPYAVLTAEERLTLLRGLERLPTG